MENSKSTLKFTTQISLCFLFMSVFISACRQETNLTQNISCNDIDSDVVWKDQVDGVDYTIDCVIGVNAKLTIEPGVVIQFKSNAGLLIENSGALVAAGTSTNPIVLQGDVDVAGVWKGLFIRSNNVQNELSYCTVANGGSASFDGNSTKLSNIRVALDAKLKITNCTISKSAKDGLFADGLDFDELNPISSFSNNTFIGNQNYPISVLGASATVLDAATTYTSNTNNKILLRGGRLFGTHSWKKMSIPYLIESVVSVGYYTNNGNLTLDPGVTVQFGADAGLCTGDYSTGSWMRIVGSSPPNIITLTGETASPGAWKGIAFQSTNANNRISYADISYAGSSSYTGNGAQRGNIMAGAWSAGSFSIDNANITNSAGYGIYATLPSPTISIPGSVYFAGNDSLNYFHE